MGKCTNTKNRVIFCLFAHLLCLHIVFEQSFVFPFLLPFSPGCYSPSFHQNICPKCISLYTAHILTSIWYYLTRPFAPKNPSSVILLLNVEPVTLVKTSWERGGFNSHSMLCIHAQLLSCFKVLRRLILRRLIESGSFFRLSIDFNISDIGLATFDRFDIIGLILLG